MDEPTIRRSSRPKKEIISASQPADEAEEMASNFDDQDGDDEGDEEVEFDEETDEDEDDEEGPYTPKSTAKSTPKSSTNKRKVADDAASTPSKKPRVQKSPAKPKKAALVHKAEPILTKLQKGVEKGFKNGETTLAQKDVKAILNYVSILRKGHDDAGTTHVLFPEPYLPPKKVKVVPVPLTEAEIESSASDLAEELICALSKKMKWTNKCRFGAAKVFADAYCDDGPEVFLKLLKLDESYIKKTGCHEFEYTETEFEERFEDLPQGSARYSTLTMREPIHVKWWPKTGHIKVHGYFGK
ncbi:hypothetical protein BJ508DRAFT_303975 [Ascobolus immersus RN42]|uniref:Uncharacterized protein n=1 Tax=Ascobolus immersus RN42 TaxID=1160509 RepID=A0A3N4IEX0_ASCIM|nr:hypothetical protein BJ508DRAFT_303975 [Ascobolus immersus RN42]